MTRAGRIGRWLAIGTGAITALLLVAAAVAYQWAQSETGRAWIALQAGRALSTPGETEVSIGRLEGRLPHEIRIGALTIADGQGVWLEAQSLRLDWHPWSLLDDSFEASLISADSVRLARLPSSPGTTTQPSAPMVSPSLPVRIMVRQLTVEQLRLDEPVMGEAIALLEAAPDLVQRLRAFVSVGERRWDIVLDRDMVVKLPGTGSINALSMVMALHYGEELLDRDIGVIDLRLPDRPALRMQPGAAETYQIRKAVAAIGGEDT